MAVGDGSAWDETNPTTNTYANQEADYQRDIRIGVRSRMAFEHEWPASQSATAQAGVHKFVTLQNQAAKPTISGTQVAAIYTKTVGAGLQEAFFENEAGTEVQLTNRGNLNAGEGYSIGDVKAIPHATIGANWLACTGGAFARSGTYAALFAVIGTLWGTGDGATTFNVPDLRSKMIWGASLAQTAAGQAVVGSVKTGYYNSNLAIAGTGNVVVGTHSSGFGYGSGGAGGLYPGNDMLPPYAALLWVIKYT